MNELEHRVCNHLCLLGNGLLAPRNKEYGLCAELESRFDIIIDNWIFSDWPKFSGNHSFPVPHPDYEGSEYAYCYLVEDNMWTNDEYGDSRRQLCIWLSNEIKNGNLIIEDDILTNKGE